MNSTVEEAELDTSFPDDPPDWDMSWFDPPERPLSLACEAGGAINSTVADDEPDISFADDNPDMDRLWSRLPRASFFSDGKARSSLAAVLLLHAAAACLLCVSPRPHADGFKSMEVQLVSMPGGPALRQGNPGARGGGQPIAPISALAPSAAPEKEKAPAPQTPIHAKKPIKRIERAAPRPKKSNELKSAEQLNSPRTETLASLSAGTAQAAESGAGAAGGFPDGGSAWRNGPGGAGPAERVFGTSDGPSFLHKVLPSYPAVARQLEKEGTVLLRVTIDERGRPVEIEVLRKAGFGFDEEAVKAVKDWTFIPAKKEGKPLACKALLPIRFVLNRS